MSTPVYGTHSFTNTPNVSGTLVMLNGGGNDQMMTGAYSARPATGNTGDLYVDSTNNVIWRDTGSAWVALNRVLNVYRTTPSITLTTSTLALSNTIPPVTAGLQVASLSITPISTSSVFRIQYSGLYDASNANNIVTQMIFSGSTCVGTSCVTVVATGRLQSIGTAIYVAPNTISPITFSVRVAGTVGTTYINRSLAAATLFGSTAGGDFLIMEVSS